MIVLKCVFAFVFVFALLSALCWVFFSIYGRQIRIKKLKKERADEADLMALEAMFPLSDVKEWDLDIVTPCPSTKDTEQEDESVKALRYQGMLLQSDERGELG